MTTALRPKEGNGRLGHVDDPEQVRLDLRPERGEVGVLDGGDVAVPGVVDDDVDASEALYGSLGRGPITAGTAEVRRR